MHLGDRRAVLHGSVVSRLFAPSENHLSSESDAVLVGQGHIFRRAHVRDDLAAQLVVERAANGPRGCLVELGDEGENADEGSRLCRAACVRQNRFDVSKACIASSCPRCLEEWDESSRLVRGGASHDLDLLLVPRQVAAQRRIVRLRRSKESPNLSGLGSGPFLLKAIAGDVEHDLAYRCKVPVGVVAPRLDVRVREDGLDVDRDAHVVLLHLQLRGLYAVEEVVSIILRDRRGVDVGDVELAHVGGHLECNLVEEDAHRVRVEYLVPRKLPQAVSLSQVAG